MKYLIAWIILFQTNKDIPPLNVKVVDYVNSVLGMQVASGECWDLAAAALDYAGAYLDRSNQKNIYVFGKSVNPRSAKIFPGDIIQFENVKLEYTRGNAIYTESMGHHTAIVLEVLEKGRYKIAHQNTSFSGRKVGVSEFNLGDVKQGEVIFYRPYRNK